MGCGIDVFGVFGVDVVGFICEAFDDGVGGCVVTCCGGIEDEGYFVAPDDAVFEVGGAFLMFVDYVGEACVFCFGCG